MSIFKCNHVSYSYDKNTNVLKDITFSFELGKVYAILGSSGSGKTTLLSLLGDLIYQLPELFYTKMKILKK